MNVIQTIHRWFGTESFIREESLRWAHLHFEGANEEVAGAVGYALVEMLGVDFKQLNRDTNIVADLGADEWGEWTEIQMCLEEELECYFAPQPGFSGRTISELVYFVADHKCAPPQQKPKRGCFPPSNWCLPACLDSSN